MIVNSKSKRRLIGVGLYCSPRVQVIHAAKGLTPLPLRAIWKEMRFFAAVVLLLPVLGSPRVAQQSRTLPSPAPPQLREDFATTDGLSCSSFQWDNPSEKGVMRAPISLNGRPYWYQFDTGADEVIPYGSSNHEGWIPRGNAVKIPNVLFAGMSFPAILGYPMKEMPDSQDPEVLHGTVGLEPLVGHTLVIDFPKQRLCLLERPDLPEGLSSQADWSPAEIRHGKLFVRVELNGKKLDGIFYDTGSSSDALALDFSLWRVATGRAGSKDATAHTKAQSWGREREFISAPASGDLKIGGHIYRKPLVTAMPTRPNAFHTENAAQGLLGNALFRQSIIVLDLGSHPEFGIIEDGSR